MTQGRQRRPTVGPIRGPDDFAAAFNVSRETIDRLETYETLLRQWQKAVNLVAPEHARRCLAPPFRRFAPSSCPSPQPARTWVDLGSGAGFPGLVVAILLAGACYPLPVSSQHGERGHARSPHPPCVTLIESDPRKWAFLREVVRQTGIGPAGSLWISCRQGSNLRRLKLVCRCHDVVCARALAPLDKLLAPCGARYSRSRHGGLIPEGRDVAAELEAAARAWNFNVELVPSLTDATAASSSIREPRSAKRRTDPDRASSCASASLPSPTRRAASARPPPPSTSARRWPPSARRC